LHKFRDAFDGFLAAARKVEVGIDDDVVEILGSMRLLDPVEQRAADDRLREILPDLMGRRVHSQPELTAEAGERRLWRVALRSAAGSEV